MIVLIQFRRADRLGSPADEAEGVKWFSLVAERDDEKAMRIGMSVLRGQSKKTPTDTTGKADSGGSKLTLYFLRLFARINDIVVIDPKSRIGVWLMPNNQTRGMLETFLQELIPETRAGLLNYAQSVTDTAKEDYQAPFKPVHQDKVVVYTFLAWMDEPGRPFGVSFLNGSLDPNSDLAQSFMAFFAVLGNTNFPILSNFNRHSKRRNQQK